MASGYRAITYNGDAAEFSHLGRRMEVNMVPHLHTILKGTF
jgi:hypothetical protein